MATADASVSLWLHELRYSTEGYDSGASRPISCPDLATMVFSARESGSETDAGDAGDLVLQHADVCRISTVFQECDEVPVGGDAPKPVVVDNLEVLVSKDVLVWLSELWYSSEEEEEGNDEDDDDSEVREIPVPINVRFLEERRVISSVKIATRRGRVAGLVWARNGNGAFQFERIISGSFTCIRCKSMKRGFISKKTR